MNCRFCGRLCNRPCGLAIHERVCKLNPDRKPLENHVCNFTNKGCSKEGGWFCKFCNLTFRTRKELQNHKHELGHISNEKCLCRCSFCGKEWLSTKYGFHNHENHCKDNPNRLLVKEHSLSESTKRRISDSLKLAHAEGRAHNIGSSRWHNEHSYPEKWFISVLEIEFGMIENIDYRTEFPFYKYSLDFAWPNKKICIEIDGEQHQRFQDQIRRDLEKDNLLKDNGWVEIRKSWKDIFNNPKLFIEEVKSILGS